MISLAPIARAFAHPLARAAALFALAPLVFLPSLGGPFIWDDNVTITENALLQLPFAEAFRLIW
ncbi:MAG: hypothetical protein ACC661_04135, partial [Verrucomicrobiales bacterium]